MKKTIAATVTTTPCTSTSWAIRRLDAAFRAMEHVEYDVFHGVYQPCWLMGTWNPRGADEVLRFAQHIVFSTMQEVGLPLRGWPEYHEFVLSWYGVTE